MTGKSGKGTARQTIRVDEDLWGTFANQCAKAGTDRSAVLRGFIRWYNNGDQAELPARPAGVDGHPESSPVRDE